ncbi:unnamed protein product [Urochloa humidicola]
MAAAPSSVDDDADRRQPPSKWPRRASYDDGTPLTNEALLAVIATVPDFAGIVRYVATCRRRHRLVSGDATFLSRVPRQLPAGKFVGALALGPFHNYHDSAVAAGPCFIPTAAWTPPVLGALVSNSGALLGSSSSRVVASRNGLIVVKLGRGKAAEPAGAGAIWLCVCNPMTSAVHTLPPLAGLNGGLIEHYVCTVLAADDFTGSTNTKPSSYFLLVVIYTCRHGLDTFLRTYGPGDGAGAAAAVAGATRPRCPTPSSARSSCTRRAAASCPGAVR